MKNANLKKCFMITGVCAILTLASTCTAFAAGWVKEGNSWRYTSNSGSYVTNEWVSSGSDKFYLNNNGYMAANQLVDDSNGTYYVNASGAMVKSQWVQIDNDWYYFQDNGKAKSDGFLTIGDKKYHFSADVMETGWLDEGDATYYLGDNGDAAVGWRYITDSDKDEGWYYFESNGKMVVEKEKKINGENYVFGSDGRMFVGWVSFTLSSGNTVYKFYDQNSGSRVNGWKYLDDMNADEYGLDTNEGWYYFKNGIAYTSNYKTTQISSDYGVAKINNQYYCFDENGQMQTGTIDGSNGSVYYFGAEDGNGQMQTGKVTVTDSSDYDEETMYFSTSGGIGNIGASFTGVKSGYLYDNGVLVKAEDEKYELVSVDSKTYIVNENGRIKESGTVRLDSDTKMKITKRTDGQGYEWNQVN